MFLTTGSFPHDNFSSVYWILTKLGHMIPLWKRKNPIYIDAHISCSTFKHNLVSLFFPAESYFDSRIASYFIIFFFQEKTLGDISFKLETKIMNFVSGFISKKNIINSPQALSIILID